jgi:spore germination protein (amino acid permease)
MVPENRKISPFLVFFLIHTMQSGIGILGFQRIIAMSAGYDAWISVLFTGICVHFLIWMIYHILESGGGDIVSVHTLILGKVGGKVICSFFILYFCLLTVTVLRNYIEIVQIWMFPHLRTFWFSLAFLILVIYIINGGIRTVTGIAFFSIILPTYILLLFMFTIPYADFTNLLPIFDHSIKELLKSSHDMSLSVLGFESLLLYYPFIKNPKESKKWAHLAILYTTLIFTYLSVISFAYFSEEQLQKNIWPTLTMWKIIRIPFVERFEYIGIANWFLVILPNSCIALWCASRLIKRLYLLRQKTAVPILAFLCLISVSMLSTRDQINYLTDITGKIGFYFNTVYIPILFAATLLAKKVKKSVPES